MTYIAIVYGALYQTMFSNHSHFRASLVITIFHLLPSVAIKVSYVSVFV